MLGLSIVNYGVGFSSAGLVGTGVKRLPVQVVVSSFVYEFPGKKYENATQVGVAYSAFSK